MKILILILSISFFSCADRTKTTENINFEAEKRAKIFSLEQRKKRELVKLKKQIKG